MNRLTGCDPTRPRLMDSASVIDGRRARGSFKSSLSGSLAGLLKRLPGLRSRKGGLGDSVRLVGGKIQIAPVDAEIVADLLQHRLVARADS